MCGICGFIGNRPVSPECLNKMNDSMFHRGPDDSGSAMFMPEAGTYCGMAHRRLAVMDLSEKGRQPAFSPDKKVALVFNGEIYNFRQLRRELAPYPFQSDCDTEVVMAAWLAWGPECVRRFNGMFALAVYDSRSKELILARDRIGKKPLYYWYDKKDGNTAFVFASELKPVMMYPGFPKEIRRDIAGSFLLRGYINAPDTVFKDVYKLEPGGILRLRAGILEKTKYWDIAAVYHRQRKYEVKNYQKAKEELKARVVAAVKKRMLADVPLGCLLSGGYDSSLVCAIAQEHCKEAPLRTYSIGFEEADYNEAEYAKAVAGYLGARHTQLYCGSKDMRTLLDDLPAYFDEPLADPSVIPSMLVARLASGDVTAVLSGDGGDEFFCGYHHYQAVRLAKFLDGVGGILHGIGKIGDLESRYPHRVRMISMNRNPCAKVQLTGGLYKDVISKMVCLDETDHTYDFDEKRYSENNWQIRRMLLDMDTYLPGMVLAKTDRATMKYSLECRCPLLDVRVMEYAMRLKHEFRWKKGSGKRILKDITHDFIPQTLLDRPKKGFSIPLESWMRTVASDALISYAQTDYLKKQGLFHPQHTNRIVERFLKNGGLHSEKTDAQICWNFFIYQQWYDYYMR